MALLRPSLALSAESPTPHTRGYWVEQAHRMAYPVLENLSRGTLLENMPVEQFSGAGRERYAHLEAVGRLLCGISPWLELPRDLTTEEGRMREELLTMAHEGLRNSVDSLSPDHLNFRDWGQPLVDAAFLAQAFLRSPERLWGELDSLTQRRMIREMEMTRATRPSYNNWLMFSATVEAFLLMAGQSADLMRTDYAFRQTDMWYIGDGHYSDGPSYHADYYNSFVIQPMLVDAARVLNRFHRREAPYSDTKLDQIIRRAGRYAELQERSISPEGTFPVIGRSILYRTGCLQSLAHAAWGEYLPAGVSPAQVRCALTAVMNRMLGADGTYDAHGWLTMGFCGAQRDAGEYYLCTGSMYLASTIFLPLGLPVDHEFWSEPDELWTTCKAWGGLPFPVDGALKD